MTEWWRPLTLGAARYNLMYEPSVGFVAVPTSVQDRSSLFTAPLFLSEDGLQWRAVPNQQTRLWGSHSASGNGVYVTSSGSGNSQPLLVSADGTNWKSTSQRWQTLSTLKFAGGSFYLAAYQDPAVYTSVDGLNWDMAFNFSGLFPKARNPVRDIAYDGNVWVLLAQKPDLSYVRV
jgi:hypothetical protein